MNDKSQGLTALVLLILLGVFVTLLFVPLMGSVYLNTGYQDWMSHAFRIKQLQTFGLTSWDHIWSTGLNPWKLYQYLPHLLTSGVAHLTRQDIPQAMILTTYLLTVMGIVVSFWVLIKQKLRPLAVTLALMLMLTTPTIWATSRDYSIYTYHLYVPLFLALWIPGISQQKTSFSTSVLAGFAWAWHPILGILTTGLWALSMVIELVSHRKLTRKLVLHGLFFAATSSIFWVPYLLKGYHFINTFLSGPDFTRITMSTDHWGFGLFMTMALLISWLGMIGFSTRIPLWSKILTVYCSVLCVMIFLMRQGFAPTLLYQTQLSRIVPMLALLLAFGVCPILHQVLNSTSRYLTVMGIAVLGALVVQVMDVTSSQLPRGTQTLAEPVSEYFSTQSPPTGTVWVADVSRASYFTNQGIRFANSYNGHMEPHPLAARLNMLMKNDLPYTGITKKQIDLINAYARALNVEYMFFPRLSSMVDSLTDEQINQPSFTVINTQVASNQFTVLKNTKPVANGYLLPVDSGVLETTPSTPTSATQSWDAWDTEIIKLDKILSSAQATPITVKFPKPELVRIELPRPTTDKELIWLNVSYDQYWTTLSPAIIHHPTSTRMMALQVPAQTSGVIELHHRWPEWHWPVQIGSTIFAILVVISEGVWHILHRKNKKHA